MAQVFAEDWAVAMQTRLFEKTKWKDFMRVDISDKKVLHNPYRTDATIATLTRYTAYTAAQVAQTDENVDIAVGFIIGEVIDHQGAMLNEKIESYIYSQHANLTDFGDTGGGVFGLAATAITLSATNVDNVITSLDKVISDAKGDSLAERNGKFIVWSTTGFEFLTQFEMANGFTAADNALSGGVKGGHDYMGYTHYKSGLLTAAHLIGGVKKVYHLGILRATYGQIVVNEKDPGLISGVGITSRLDLAVKAWAKTKPVIFDINAS
jgi:hypothetical protein